MRARFSAPFGFQALSQHEAFAARFSDWLEQAHPQIAGGFAPLVATRMPAAEDVPVALGYVAEFVAQSKLYPQLPTRSGQPLNP